MPAAQTANDRIAAYLAAPSLDAWKALRTMLIPGTGRTLWQAWVSVDGSATTSAAAPQLPWVIVAMSGEVHRPSMPASGSPYSHRKLANSARPRPHSPCRLPPRAGGWRRGDAGCSSRYFGPWGTSGARLCASRMAMPRWTVAAPSIGMGAEAMPRQLRWPWSGGFVGLARAAGIDRIELGRAPQISATCSASATRLTLDTFTAAIAA